MMHFGGQADQGAGMYLKLFQQIKLIIQDGSSEQVAHIWSKIGLFRVKNFGIDNSLDV